jgi:phosphoribosyl 1,2-cyclic phosphodiesterase
MEHGKLDRELRNQTRENVLYTIERWRHRTGQPEHPPGYRLTFLGTGGNPEAVISQDPRTAGFVVNLGELCMHVDPGPGAVIRSLDAGLDPANLDAIYISHGHLDHYAGVESVVEGMCWAMSTRRGLLLAPAEVLEDRNLVSRYHQGRGDYGPYRGGPRALILKPFQYLSIKDIMLTPIPAYHGGENYGFILEHPRLRLGYTSDTNYIRSYRTPAGILQVSRDPLMDMSEILTWRQDVREYFRHVDVLVANITTHNFWAHRHITTLGLAHLLKGARVKKCLITHFNRSCLYPVDLRAKMASFVAEVSGVPTYPAYDGAVFDLEEVARD